MTEKLQKILSRAGIASRRALEDMIDKGRVTVNGKLATIGDRYEAEEITVKIDGKNVLSPNSSQVACRVLMYHKPEGELTTLSDPENRPTVFDHIPQPPAGRWIYIGRLDINTSGLLLFTTDGELANSLMHPKFEIERVYAARIYGDVTDDQINQLQKGVMLEDGKASFSKVVYQGGEGRNAWYHVTLKEGRKREVRRLWEAVGLNVSRLIRIKYAGINLDPEIKTGEFRELTLSEINKLRSAVNLDPIESLAPALNLKNASASTRRRSTVRPSIDKDFLDKDNNADSNEESTSKRSSAPRSFNRDRNGEGRSFNRDRNGEGRSFNRDRNGEGRSFNRDRNGEGRSFNRDRNGEGRSFNRDRNGEGRSFNRNGEGRSFDRNGEGRSFNRNGEGRSFNRNGEGRSFNRNGEGRSFNRNGEGRSFNRNGEGRSFDRNGEGRSFNRNGEGRSFDRNGEGRSFNRDRNGEGRSFNRNGEGRSFNRNGEGRSFNRNGEGRSFNRNGDSRPSKSFSREESTRGNNFGGKVIVRSEASNSRPHSNGGFNKSKGFAVKSKGSARRGFSSHSSNSRNRFDR